MSDNVNVMPNRLFDFILGHSRFGHPDIILQDNVTLYAVHPTYAVFVETDPDKSVDASNVHAFMKTAQFEYAKRVVIIPIESFHRMAQKVGAPNNRVVFLLTTGQCGSTLVCKLLQSTCFRELHPSVFGFPSARFEKFRLNE